MFYDTLYRHNQALSPAGLDHLPAALHALNAAVEDCQRAGKPVASDAATLLLIRHLADVAERSEEHTSELQSLMRISYAVFCLKKKIYKQNKICKLTYNTKHIDTRNKYNTSTNHNKNSHN